MIEPIKLKITDISMIIGMRGSGKTTLAKYLAKQYLDKGLNMMVYDPNAEYGDLEKQYPIERYVPKAILDLNEFDNFIMDLWRKRYTIGLLEEVDLYAPSHSISREFQRLIALGRHRHIGLICCSRRPRGINKLLCSQANKWFIFKMTIPEDIDYLRKFIGDAVKDAVNLPDYHFIYWSHGKAVKYNPIEVL